MENFSRLAESHLFDRLGKSILFNVETMLFYEVTPVIRDVISLLHDPSQTDPIQVLLQQYSIQEIEQAVAYLLREGFLKETGRGGKTNKPRLIKRYGIRHLELMVTHDCNMRCRYCYGSLGKDEWQDSPYLYGSNSKGMSLETARRGVEYLLEHSGGRKELSVIFFGGEPLLEYRLIQELVPYIREREREAAKKIDISLSTNGLLLSPKVIDFLRRNNISCQISLDGPMDLHDRNRLLVNGAGSYSQAMEGIRRLLAIRPGRAPARATVSRGHVDLIRVIEHLLTLGFGSAHVEPAIGGNDEIAITQEDVERIKEQNETIALFLIKNVKRNRFFNYTNLVRFIRQTRIVRDRLAHYCGAGRTYFALSQDGVFYPCHRFVGMEEYSMGDLDRGMDLTLRNRILNLTVDNRPVCRECWARYLCGGGCWKHAVDANNCLETPDSAVSCDLIRHQIEVAMAVNSELNVSDKDILDDLYEETTEPYLVTEKEGGTHGPQGGKLAAG